MNCETVGNRKTWTLGVTTRAYVRQSDSCDNNASTPSQTYNWHPKLRPIFNPMASHKKNDGVYKIKIYFFVGIVFVASLLGCRQRLAYQELSAMHRDLDAIVKRLDISSSGVRPDVAKDSKASVGVYIKGQQNIKRVMSALARVAHVYGYTIPNQRRSLLLICHGELAYRYVYFAALKGGNVAELLIVSEAYKAAYPACAVS